MFFPFGSRIRHPFYPGLAPTPAVEARRPCAALYGTFRELVESNVPVRRAVFVVYAEGEPFLKEEERDLLWGKFQVPIFVLLLDSTGRVIACECEVQDGLHVAPGYGLPGRPRGLPRQESEICDCGRPGCKLKIA